MDTITNESLLAYCGEKSYSTIYADPPWQFSNRSGKIAPENRKLTRYDTMTLDDIKQLPINEIAAEQAHLYLWVPNALLPEGLEVMKAWGFTYKTNLIWEKTRKDGQPDGRGVGFYFRNVTEVLLFGVKTKRKNDTFRTLQPGRSQVNLLRSMNLVRILNYLLEEPEQGGIFGVIKPTMSMNHPGQPMRITHNNEAATAICGGCLFLLECYKRQANIS